MNGRNVAADGPSVAVNLPLRKLTLPLSRALEPGRVGR